MVSPEVRNSGNPICQWNIWSAAASTPLWLRSCAMSVKAVSPLRSATALHTNSGDTIPIDFFISNATLALIEMFLFALSANVGPLHYLCGGQ